MARVLLTGSAGFIGSYVYEELERRGHTVTGVDCYSRQVHGENPKKDPRIKDMSVRNYAIQWAKDSVNIHHDIVIHLAAEVGVGQSQYEIAKYVDRNVNDTAILMQAVKQRKDEVKRVVVASSMSIYGEGTYRIGSTGFNHVVRKPELHTDGEGWDAFVRHERDEIKPMPTPEWKAIDCTSIYAMTKYDTEKYALITGAAHDIPTIALRFFNTYGPRQALANPYTGAVALFSCRSLNGKPAFVFEDGEQLRDFVFVEDVAQAVCDAAEAPEKVRGAFNVCTGESHSIKTLATMIAKLCGGPDPKIVPVGRKGDVRHCYGDNTKIHDNLGWEPQYSLLQGLEKTLEWLRDQKLPEDRQEAAFEELRAAGVLIEP